MNRIRCELAAFAFALSLSVGIAATTASAATVRGAVRHAGPSIHLPSGLDGMPIIGQLHHVVTIGSTVDPKNGDQNPYGLAIAPVTAGKMTAGDLVICNFNDGLNIQGLGTTIEVLHPTPGSTPQRLVQSGALTGCDAISLSPGDNPWLADWTANDNPILAPNGKILVSLSGKPFAQPFGQTFSPTNGPYGQGAFYESNANDGSIVRIGLTNAGFKIRVIATGFSVNHGVPGAILAPSGLTYDTTNDTLYIVDGNVNRVVAIRNVSLVPPHGIQVDGNRFTGIAGSLARVVWRGSPLLAPISAALLFNGNLVVGNTGNNVLVELNPRKPSVVHTVNLDKGVVGALFGIAATGSSVATTQVFFNDDNDNTVKVLEQ